MRSCRCRTRPSRWTGYNSAPLLYAQLYLLAEEEAHPCDDEGAQELIDLPGGHKSGFALPALPVALYSFQHTAGLRKR